MLNAVDLEERFKKTLPMLTRQIEGLKLLQKTRKPKPDDEKRVGLSVLTVYASSPSSPLFFFLHWCQWCKCFVLQVLVIRKGSGVLPGRQFSLEEEGEDENGDEMAVLERKVNEAAMPESALRVCLKELKRYVLPERFCFSFMPLCFQNYIQIHT